MISDRRRGIQHLVLLSQCILASLAFWVGLLLFDYPHFADGPLSHFLIGNQVVLLGLLIGAGPLRLEIDLHTPTFWETKLLSFRQLGTALLFLVAFLAAAPGARISLAFILALVLLLYFILEWTNQFLPACLGHLSFREAMRERILLLGPRPEAAQVKRWLDDNQHLGLEVLGLVTEDPDDATAAWLPTLGRPEDLPKVLAKNGIMNVILAALPRRDIAIRDYTRLCEGRGVRLLVVADLNEIFGHPPLVFGDQGRFLIGLRREPLENPINRFLKRGVDLLISVPVVGFVLPPLLFFAWIGQRLQSPGPLLFVQPREGFHNESFGILKLRTMHVGDPANVTLPASKHDPRLYRIGRFLRRTSLDEMPQFWNVLRGEMSVVGPRPHPRSYNQQYQRVFLPAYVRGFVKPGITGLAQARGLRGAAATPDEVVQRIRSDLEYLEHWSLWLDLWLMIRTLHQVFIPPKAAL